MTTTRNLATAMPGAKKVQLNAHKLAESVLEVLAHSSYDGAGTKKTGYALPEMGPFKCSNCIHANEDSTRCDHPKVETDPDVPQDGGKAVIKPEACCNYFHPKDKE
jgi:hypothetical protein